MRRLQKIEFVSDRYKSISLHGMGGLQVDGYFRGGSTAAYDLQEPDMVLAILGFANLIERAP